MFVKRMLTLTAMKTLTITRIRTLASRIWTTRQQERLRLKPAPTPAELELRLMLKALPYGEIAQLAQKVEISRAYLHDVKNGRRSVSESLAQKLSELRK